MMSTLDDLEARSQAKKQANRQQLDSLIEQIAVDENSVDADELLSACEAVGIEVEDTYSMVAIQRRRNRLRAVLARHAEMASEKAGIEDAIREADAALEQARRDRAVAVAPLHSRLRAIADAATQAYQAKRELESLITPAQAEAISDANAKHQKAAQLLTLADRAVRDAQSRVDNCNREPNERDGWVKEGTVLVDEPAKARATKALKAAQQSLQRARQAEADAKREAESVQREVLL